MRRVLCLFALGALLGITLQAQTPSAVTAIRAGRLLDPEAGRVLTKWIPGPTIINSGIIIGGMGGQVFKKDGVMTPASFFHGGPVNGWRIR
ncbi:MAG: hypothetical protein HY047_16450 [Acidobacteria bacterium]|nr:hypothetical protein [Acidobacteriota bacterium]